MAEVNQTELPQDHRPILIQESGSNVIMVDYQDYRELPDEASRNAYKAQLVEEVRQLNIPERTQGYVIEDMMANLDASLTDPEILADYGGGYQVFRMDNEAIITTDSQAITLESRISTGLGTEYTAEETARLRSQVNFDFSPREEEIYDYFVEQHELAHAQHGLEEPGADYLAATRTLERFPDAAPTLMLIADTRITNVMVPGRTPSDHDHYGYENFQAIQAAITTPTDVLEDRSSEAEVDAARHFDEIKATNSRLPLEQRPDIQVRNALWSEASTTMSSQNLDAIATVPGRVENRFDPHSEEAQVLREFDEAMERLSDRGYELGPEPGMAPSVAPAAAPTGATISNSPRPF